MKKLSRTICVFLSLLFLLSLCPAFTVADDAVYVRKHVSILYDDSGSMRVNDDGTGTLKWCYASYAAQVFTSLLNDSDKLKVTLMNGKPLYDLDLVGPRQNAVDAVFNATGIVKGNTPINSIRTALNILIGEGLKKGLGANEQGEQYWLVLTTDGRFTLEDGSAVFCSKDRVVNEMISILEDYPDLNLVYFGIGSDNDDSGVNAWDFSVGAVDPAEENADVPPAKPHAEYVNELNSYSNFKAEYSKTQDDIVKTMQRLSNRISGRYSANDNCTVNGSEVTLNISSEGAPMRNIALLAQNTNAVLQRAVTEDGGELKISRSAEIKYPYNANYLSNMPEGTLGGYAALITGSDSDKIPSGTVKLYFSEPIEKDNLSVMFEPSILISLKIERKNAQGEWEPISEMDELTEGDEIRIDYDICEDGTGRVLDVDELFGETETEILFNGRPVEVGEVIKTEKGDSLLNIRVSMMDGDYQISKTSTIRVHETTAGDFAAYSSGPIEIIRKDAAENTDKYIDFTVRIRGEVPADEYMSKLSVKTSGEGGASLGGASETLAQGVIRFTPRDAACKAGDYTVGLYYDGEEICTETVTILPNETTYTAEAGGSISIFSNRVADNTDYVTFTVTAHRDDSEGPITEEESKLFRVIAEGTPVSGVTGYLDEGVITFTLRDASAAPGDYQVSLWKDDQKLATANISVVRYDAAFTVQTVVSDPDEVNRFALHENEANVSFIVFEDGTPVSATQLEAMLDQQLFVSSSVKSRLMDLDVKVGEVNGMPAVVCTPKESAKHWLSRQLHNIVKAYGGLAAGDIDVTLKVEAIKGGSGTGTLKLVGYNPLYLLPPIILLVLLALIGMWAAANMLSVRFSKGGIWTFSLIYSEFDNLFSVNNLNCKSIGMKLRAILLPVKEKAEVKGISFVAEPDAWSPSKRYRHVTPTATVNCSRGDAHRYTFVSFADPESAEVLEGIITRRKNKIRRSECSDLMNGTELFEYDYFEGDDNKNQRLSAKRKMSSGSMIIREDTSTGVEEYTVWCYKRRAVNAVKRKKSFFERIKDILGR